MKYTVGLDLGVTSVKIAVVSKEEVLFEKREPHFGNTIGVTKDLLKKLNRKFDLEDCAAYAVTGQSADVLREYCKELPIFETVPALREGARVLAPEARSIIAIGGQTAVYLTGLTEGQVPRFSMNESCASGTGSFFEDQMGRLGMELEEYSAMTRKAQSIPRLSGRCAVFAKTDIIHRQQEGVPVEDILLGLCYAMARSYKSSIVKNLPVVPPVLLTGGVALNEGLVDAMQSVFNLRDEELLVSDRYLCLQAVGAAAGATSVPQQTSLSELIDALSGTAGITEPMFRLEALQDPGALPTLDTTAVQAELRAAKEADPNYVKRPCTLGIDVGSTSTNLILLDDKGNVIDYQYLRTRGDPKAVVQEGIASLEERLGDLIQVKRTGVTGSGRHMIGKLIGAETVRDEITAQARGAFLANPAVDTVFEIGGQDSKYIHMSGGQVDDFQMNKICAAGTGSFIEEQAGRLDIPLSEYGAVGLSSKQPLDLGERCTVFVETAINAALSKGADKADVAAGLCLSVVRNYLHKVVGTKRVGDHIVLQGGICYNPATVAAFRQFYGDKIMVNPWFSVSGAIGVASLAQEEAAKEVPAESEEEREERVRLNRHYYAETKKLFLANYEAPSLENGELTPEGKLCCDRKTVGVPRSLMIHKLFPMLNGFLTEMGLRVVLSEESSEETIRLAQQRCTAECCYPVKLIYGHMEQLANMGVDYIFMPKMHSIRHICSQVEHNYACSFMQVAPEMVARTLHLKERGIELISPELDMDFGEEMLATAMLSLGSRFGKDQRETALAMMTGGLAISDYSAKTEELGEELVKSLKPGEKALVLITRQYGIEDPALNMNIPEELLKRGIKVINLSHLHAHNLDISDEYPGMYWPFGQHILSGARIVRNTPGLYAVYLTNHGCGPDSMISHLFREEMGDKPYLQIEVDEHYSKVGVITRIEAFLNSLNQSGNEGFAQSWLERLVAVQETPGNGVAMLSATKEDTHPDLFGQWGSQKQVSDQIPLQSAVPVAVPDYGIYGRLVGGLLEQFGYETHLLSPTAEALGRGRQQTTSKEYYTFSMLLGMALQAAETADEGHLQFLLPANEGADADGVYWRVIRAILDEQGRSDLPIVPARFDTLLQDSLTQKNGEDATKTPEFNEQFFLRLLWGDLYYATPAEDRDTLFGEEVNRPLTMDLLLQKADQIRSAYEDRKNEHPFVKTLLVNGEWPLVYEDNLVDGMYTQLELQGYRLKRMSAAEYLWFLWNDRERGVAVARDPVSTDAPLILDRYAEWIQELHSHLGEASPFAPNMNALGAVAKDALGGFTSANGRYRYGEKRVLSDGVDGILNVASMYENTDMILKDLDDTVSAPLLNLSFDGVQSQETAQKLQSFLFYL